jgi:hypothetical protein
MSAPEMKAEQVGRARWRVLAIPFGGPFKGGKDLDGEFFSARTDVKATWFRERPALFQHGADKIIGSDEIGTEGEMKQEDDGWWADLWLDRSHRYWAQVDALLRAGKMYGSSGALSHLVRKDRATGEILVWPHIEQTLTPTPANPYARITASKSLIVDLESAPADLAAYLPDEGGERMAMLDDAARRLEQVRLDLRRI